MRTEAEGRAGKRRKGEQVDDCLSCLAVSVPQTLELRCDTGT